MPAGSLIRTLGTGPDLVLVHGWGMGAGAWGELPGLLARDWRLHLVDLPGHGEAPDTDWTSQSLVADLLARTPPAPWLGWSLGGQLALAAALAAPTRIHALVLLATTPRFVAGPQWPHGMEADVFQEFTEGMARDPGRTLDRFQALVAAGGPAPRTVLTALRALPRPGPLGLAAGLAALRDTDLVAALPGLDTPVLWVAGAGDRLVATDAVRAAAALHPAGQQHELAACGHAPQLERPDAVAALVGSFLTREAAA